MSRTLAELAKRASEGAVGLARSVLEADIANRAFTDQVGPALTQADAARLLGRSEQAVSKVQPTTAASWLTASNPQLADRRPVEALDDGDLDDVVAVAACFADRMAVC